MDSSIYGALVRLAQDWIMRYPLIDFHGNVGNIAGDGPAAPRYTEARLAKISEDGLLQGLKKKNVDFIPNYDETLEEPVTLPAIFPNLLCNPNSGIGVAIACNWAPHNLKEVAAAIIDYMDGKTPFLPGPDFPTGGVIINAKDIPAIMKTGHGSVKVRGKYKIEKNKIIFYEIPYGTSIEDIIEEMGKVSDEKIIEGIVDVHDESNKNGIRIVIEFDKAIAPDPLINKLFKETDLQISFSYNQVALVNKVPTELNLKDCIEIYVNHNKDCLTREVNFDLEKAKDRLEVVEGLLKALEDIDNIISLIKSSESAAAAKIRLINKYNFTENQAKAILAMRLSSLAKLESIELNEEKDELKNNITNYLNILNNDSEKDKIIKERLLDLVKKYGDDRRTELQNLEIKIEEKEVEEVIPEDVVIIMTQTGYIKRVPKTAFKIQKKKGKGIKTKDEAVLDTISTNTVDTLVLFSNKGKMYRLLVDKIPVGTNATKGAHIKTLIKIEDNEDIICITSLYRKTNAEYVVFFTKKGLIKKTLLSEYLDMKKSTGIQAIKIKDGDALANVTFLKDEDVIFITKKGMSIRIPTIDISPIGRVTAGVIGIKLNADDEVLVGLPVHKESDYIGLITTKGMGKKVSVKNFSVQKRAGKGVIVYKLDSLIGEVVGAEMVDDNDNLFLLGSPNSICISAKDLTAATKINSGSIIIRDSQVKSVVKF